MRHTELHQAAGEGRALGWSEIPEFVLSPAP